MIGPVEVGDASGVYWQWTCPECGKVCERFRWEWPGEKPRDPNIRTLGEYYADRGYQK